MSHFRATACTRLSPPRGPMVPSRAARDGATRATLVEQRDTCRSSLACGTVRLMKIYLTSLVVRSHEAESRTVGSSFAIHKTIPGRRSRDGAHVIIGKIPCLRGLACATCGEVRRALSIS